MADTPVPDHLAVACRNLDEGAAWVGAHLGIPPDAGGRHPRIGTHNRLPDHGQRLTALELSHPAPLPDLPVDVPRVTLREGPVAIRARILNPKGPILP